MIFSELKKLLLKRKPPAQATNRNIHVKPGFLDKTGLFVSSLFDKKFFQAVQK